MPDPISFGESDFKLVSSMEERQAVPRQDTAFRILLLGDFSGRQNRNPAAAFGLPLRERRLLQVDRDNLESVLAGLKVRLDLSILGEKAPPVSIHVAELDDFHPDALYRKLDVFQALKDTRESLTDPAACAELFQAASAAEKKSTHAYTTPVGSLDEGSLLDQVVAQSDQLGETDGDEAGPTEWQGFLQDIVTPHLVPKAHPQIEEMREAVDAAAGELMRMILHHEDFQALEAAWRGLSFLLSRLETDERLQVFLLDVTKEELAADLDCGDLRETFMYRLLVDEAVGVAGGEPWSVVGGNFSFAMKEENMRLLAHMAKISRAAGAPFLAAAHDRMVCADSLFATPDADDWQPVHDRAAELAWQQLRESTESAYVGLCLPKFLLRLPYGDDTDPIDSFVFEEMPHGAEHGRYLWGNPCMAMLLLLGQAFSIQGWQMRPGVILDIDNLPLHVYKQDGESRIKPCTEALLSQRTAERILENGLMALLSFMNQDRARLARFQSIAWPLSALAGPWE